MEWSGVEWSGVEWRGVVGVDVDARVMYWVFVWGVGVLELERRLGIGIEIRKTVLKIRIRRW